jgi:NAD+ synthase
MFTAEVLNIDAAAEAERIQGAIVQQVRGELRRKGVVVGLSGGVDSAVVAALASRALGPERVLGLLMPERDSGEVGLRLARELAAVLGIESLVEDITATLEAAGCYRRQEEAIAPLFPEYGPGYKSKVTLPPILQGQSERISIPLLTIEAPNGEVKTTRMTAESYRRLVAATNFKQRIRKVMEYYHADRLAFAVAGTPNRLEYDQGFFVKQGDGAADLKPIAHLYKTQVFALAAFLGVPREICERVPSTDTYSMPQTQEEFFFALPHARIDLCMYALDHGVPPHEVAGALGLTVEQIEHINADIVAKRRTTRYQHAPPLLVESLQEVDRPCAESPASSP